METLLVILQSLCEVALLIVHTSHVHVSGGHIWALRPHRLQRDRETLPVICESLCGATPRAGPGTKAPLAQPQQGSNHAKNWYGTVRVRCNTGTVIQYWCGTRTGTVQYSYVQYYNLQYWYTVQYWYGKVLVRYNTGTILIIYLHWYSYIIQYWHKY